MFREMSSFAILAGGKKETPFQRKVVPNIPKMASKLYDIDQLVTYSHLKDFLKSSGSPGTYYMLNIHNMHR